MIRTLLGHLCGDQKHCWATAVIRDTAVIRGTAGPLVWRSGTLLANLCGDQGHCWVTCVVIWATAAIRDTAVIRDTAWTTCAAIGDTAVIRDTAGTLRRSGT
ncbi:unnamed protein product, partial [Staurois parvus]